MDFDSRTHGTTRIILLCLFFAGCLSVGRYLGGQQGGRLDEARRNVGSDAKASVRRSPIVVELFTSQGCSSCPPADELLRHLGDGSLGGPEVLPLAFHVDYWNYIGWRDPFSSERWSDRQREYSRVLSPGRVYTPQLVIDGREHHVGSDFRAIDRALHEAKTRPPAFEIQLRGSLARNQELVLDWDMQSRSPTTRPLEIWTAVHESGLSTPISRGENARRTLRNDYVVRLFERLGTLQPGTSRDTARHELDLDWDGDPRKMGAVVFLQDPETFAIEGAAGVSGLQEPARGSAGGP